jgi:hypothetical protein
VLGGIEKGAETGARAFLVGYGVTMCDELVEDMDMDLGGTSDVPARVCMV